MGAAGVKRCPSDERLYEVLKQRQDLANERTGLCVACLCTDFADLYYVLTDLRNRCLFHPSNGMFHPSSLELLD